MNPQGIQFPLGLPQGQQQGFNPGLQQNAAPGQMGMPTAGESSSMGANMQNAAQMIQVSFCTRIRSISWFTGWQASRQQAGKV